MMKTTTYSIWLCAIAIAFVLGACSSGKDKPGWVFMPDMMYSTAVEAYSQNRVEDDMQNMISNSASARIPDSRSIPHGYLPENIADRQNTSFMRSWAFKNHYANWNFQPENYQALYDAAGAEVNNPLSVTENNLLVGKKLYDIQCAVCHGTKGMGDGSIVNAKDDQGNDIDGPYTAIPPSYKDRLPGLSDGNIFYSVTYGKNMMGGYAHALNVEQRWQVILYIKELAGLNQPIAPGIDEEMVTPSDEEAVEPESAMAH